MWKSLGGYDKWMFAVLMLMMLSVNTSTGGSSTAIGLGAAVMLVQGFRAKKFPRVDTGIGRVFLAYIAVWALISICSVDAWHSFRELLGASYRFLPLFFAMLYIRHKWQLKWLWLAFGASVFVNDCTAFWQYANGWDYGWGNRPIGLSHSPTFLASNMLMAIPVLSFTSMREYMHGWAGNFLRLTAVLSFVTLVLSGTRGGWLAFLAVLVLYACCHKRFRKKILAFFVAVSVAAGAGFAVLPSFHDRVSTMADPSFRSNSERLLMWQAATEIFRDYPLTGVGMDMFGWFYNTEYISPLAMERAVNPADPWSGHGHPHNNLMQNLAEGGMLGFSMFLLMHGYFLWRFYRLWKAEKAAFPYGLMMILVFAGLQLEGMTDTNMKQVPIMREYWLLCGTAFLAARLEAGKKGMV